MACVTATAPAPDTVNGRTFTRTPLQVAARQTFELVLRGFEPLTRVRLRLFSEPVDLGEITADAEGTVRTTVTVPAVNPGVHSLEAESSAAAGVQVTKQVLLSITGRPTGEYSTYLCCFTPEPAEIPADAPVERVVVSVAGVELGTYLPDEYGGVLVQVASVDRLTDPSALVIEGRSTLNGAVIRQTVNPIPTAPSLWATSTGNTAISVTSSGFQAAGLVHSEGGIQIRGARIALTGGTEYASRLGVFGAPPTVRPAAVRVPAGQGLPPVSDIAAYRPGGLVASSGVPYRAVDPTACRDGVWSPRPGEALTGVVYVPCAVALIGSGNVVPATIAAEGTVRLTGFGLKLGVSSPGAPSVVTGAKGEDAVLIVGANTVLIGAVHASGGSVHVIGTNARLECGIVASAITVQGSGVSAPMSERCLRT